MQTAAFDAEVHHAFIDPLRRTGRAPSRHDVAVALARPINEIEQAPTFGVDSESPLS